MTALSLLRENAGATGPKVVSAGHKAAAAAGAAAFSLGGNAFDAALAACFMEQVTLPMKCGLAGDLVALYRRKGEPFQALISIGPGASGLASGARMQRVGPTSVGVPGAPHGYSLLADFARLSLSTLAAPAIEAANRGVPWTRVALSYLNEAVKLLAEFSPENPYMPQGRLPQIGDIRRLPGLGDLLGSFVKRRAAVFEGSHGEEIIERLGPGGLLSMADFRSRPGHILEPAKGKIAPGLSLTVTPSPTHGPELINICRAALDSSLPLPQVVAEARRAAAARGRQATDAGTSVVVAADDIGNAVVVLHSNSFPQFASGIVLESGLILSNRPGRGFDLNAPASAANAPAAGRIPWTTLHAWCLESESDLLLGATPGGVNQLPWNSQMVCELARGFKLGDAIVAPRWALSADGICTAEEGCGEAAPGSQPIEALSLRSAQQVVRLSRNGFHTIAADPRSGATALAIY